ncbi:MAG: glutaredoxin family protein [Phycisphaerae bacterium]
MKRVTLFTKADCPLCRGALFVLERVRRQLGFSLEIVDITRPGHETWLEAYRDHIPVVHIDGDEVFRHRVHEGRLRELLTKTE